MATNRNHLREDAVELAALISKITAGIENGGEYSDQLHRSVITVGSALTSIKNSRDEVSIVRRLTIAMDGCAEISFVSKVLLVRELISEDDYKLIKRNVMALERRISVSLSE